MIGERDANFHPPDLGDPEWAEIVSAGFCVPAEAINVRTYTLFRRQFGVAQTSVTMISRDALHPWHADYADFRPHVPAPNSLLNFSMSHGLSVETEQPHKLWRMRFADTDGMAAFDIRFEALAPPFSPFDPAQNPNARPALDGVGHYEQSVRATGTLCIRGHSHDVDCRTLVNHGWGPRRDRKITILADADGITWLHAHFPNGDAIYGNWTFSFASDDTLKLLYGYRLHNGAIHGLVSGRGHVTRDAEGYPVSIAISVTEPSGCVHSLRARVIHRSYWTAWPNIMTKCIFAEWIDSNGTIGHGDILQFNDVANMIRSSSDPH